MFFGGFIKSLWNQYHTIVSGFWRKENLERKTLTLLLTGSYSDLETRCTIKGSLMTEIHACTVSGFHSRAVFSALLQCQKY